MNTFFITGLPRTRTAWLANLFTTGQVFCFHEAPLFSEMKIECLPGLFASTNAEYVGDSDSAIPFYSDWLAKAFPNSKWVYVKGDIEKTIKECNVIFGRDTTKAAQICQQRLELFEKQFTPLIISVDDLDDKDVVSMLWDYCVPTIPFNEQRYLMLRDFDIKLTEKGLDKRRCLPCL